VRSGRWSLDAWLRRAARGASSTRIAHRREQVAKRIRGWDAVLRIRAGRHHHLRRSSGRPHPSVAISRLRRLTWLGPSSGERPGVSDRCCWRQGRKRRSGAGENAPRPASVRARRAAGVRARDARLPPASRGSGCRRARLFPAEWKAKRIEARRSGPRGRTGVGEGSPGRRSESWRCPRAALVLNLVPRRAMRSRGWPRRRLAELVDRRLLELDTEPVPELRSVSGTVAVDGDAFGGALRGCADRRESWPRRASGRGEAVVEAAGSGLEERDVLGGEAPGDLGCERVLELGQSGLGGRHAILLPVGAVGRFCNRWPTALHCRGQETAVEPWPAIPPPQRETSPLRDAWSERAADRGSNGGRARHKRGLVW